MKYVRKQSILTLAAGLGLAACAGGAEDDGGSSATNSSVPAAQPQAGSASPGVNASAPGVNAQVGPNGVSASAPGVSAQAGPNGVGAMAPGVGVAAGAEVAQAALDELTGNVDIAVDGFNDDGQVPVPPSSSETPSNSAGRPTHKVKLPCATGGDAEVDGYVNVVPAPVAVDVKLAITFNGCNTDSGTTLNGDVSFSQTVITGPDVPLQVETIYQGDVTLVGSVNVTCPIDLKVLVDETGRAVSIEGMFCNEDASELSLQLQPRWAL